MCQKYYYLNLVSSVPPFLPFFCSKSQSRIPCYFQSSWLLKYPLIWVNFPVFSCFLWGFPDGKRFTCSSGDLGLIPRLGRSPKGGNGNSSILPWEIPWTGAWQATVHGVAKESDTTERLNSNIGHKFEGTQFNSIQSTWTQRFILWIRICWFISSNCSNFVLGSSSSLVLASFSQVPILHSFLFSFLFCLFQSLSVSVHLPYFLRLKDTPGSFYTILVPPLEAAISLYSPDSFYGRMLLRKIQAQGVFVAIRMWLLLGLSTKLGNKRICAKWCTHAYLCILLYL